jgi:hypothetical protein
MRSAAISKHGDVPGGGNRRDFEEVDRHASEADTSHARSGVNATPRASGIDALM